MKRATKIWHGLGAWAAVAAIGPAVTDELGLATQDLPFIPAAYAGDEGGDVGADPFPGDFDTALDKIFAGEGGEGGHGISTMWPRVSVPALTGKQIREAIPGNTLHNPHHDAIYFDKSGDLEGWEIKWTEVTNDDAGDKCPETGLSDNGKYWAEDGQCWQKNTSEVTGSWEISGHTLCTETVAWGKEDETCWYVALLLDNVALFDETGTLSGKGRTLKRGKVIERD